MDPSDLLLRPPCRQRNSIIRALAQWLPLPAASRIHFQEELLRSVHAYQVQSHSVHIEQTNDESLKNIWYTPTPVTLADISWLVRDDGDEGILLRCQLYSTDPILSSTPVSFRPKTRRRASMQCGAHGHAPVDIHNHTPINSSIYSTSFPSQHTSQRHSDTLNTPVSGFQTPDKAAMTKIGKLESELLQLRQQLAAIALKQEQMSSNSVMDVSAPVVPSSIPAAPPLPMCGPPPPPPPPPPPSFLAIPQMSIKDIIKKNKGAKGSTSSNKPPTGKNQPDMSEVLKGLGNVKLRSVKRSPGGTPVREKPRPCNVNDPAAMIALALKKKFSGLYTASPDKENSPGTGGFTPSPRRDSTPPAPHYLGTKLKRRSRNFPLKEINGNK